MRTTVDLNDSLARKAKALAVKRETTLRALIEDGLRRVLQDEKGRSAGFTLRDASVGGTGPLPGVDLTRWETFAHALYAGRSS